MFALSAAIMLAIAGGIGYSSSVAAATAPGHPLQPQPTIGQPGGAPVPDGRALLLGVAIAFAAMAVASVGLGWLVAGRVLRPLREMTVTTRRITADSLDERLGLPGPRDELKELGDTIDGLLERLEHSFAAQRRFVANASHELRTPLATMRASLDVAAAKPGHVPAQTLALAARLRGELDRVDGLLEGFLALARAQHGILPDQAVLSLGGIAAESLAERARAIGSAGLAVEASCSPIEDRVAGSPALLRCMIDNVLDNAIRHNEDGGWICVTTQADQRTAWIAVETGGRVLDQSQVDQLVLPFRRLGADRTGSEKGAGLGLSIVASIAAAHGGTLNLRARPSGGLRVAIALPRAVQLVPAGATA